MSSTHVAVLVPLAKRCAELPATVEAVETYLHSTGFAFVVRVLDCNDASYGSVLRRAVSEQSDSLVVVLDPDLPYPVAAVGDAIALLESGSADVVFGGARNASPLPLVDWLLVPELPDPRLHLKAFSSEAARMLFAESKLNDSGCDLEVAYLANRYGFRLERVAVDLNGAARSPLGWLSSMRAAVAVRLNDRRNAYRAPRRCPVCFSSEVWSSAQIAGNVVRACGRCKCRYLNRLPDPEGTHVPRVLRAHAAVADTPADPLDETAHGRSAREKTSSRRLGVLRKQVPARGRVLEIGVRDGSFGAAASREYEYVGIDRAATVARGARARGLEVYCSTVAGFVNTGPAFDAVTVYHVFENMADPHDAIARIKDLLKPGGVLLLSALDTEGVLFPWNERKRAAQNFRTHLILYSRSALIELLERSGFEIVNVAPEFEYRDHKFIRHRVAARWPSVAPLIRAALGVLPDPMLVSSGSIRIVAKRRAGAPLNVRGIRSVEPTHAR
jgi:SAM-dependent methyltransferase